MIKKMLNFIFSHHWVKCLSFSESEKHQRPINVAIILVLGPGFGHNLLHCLLWFSTSNEGSSHVIVQSFAIKNTKITLVNLNNIFCGNKSKRACFEMNER